MNINPNTIRHMMGARLMTQGQLAEEAGVARMTINAALRRGTCSTGTARKIAHALKVEPADIVGREAD